MVEAKGRVIEEMAFGPVFSSQVWSIVWLAADWPRIKVIFGRRRCIRKGKNPSMFEK